MVSSSRQRKCYYLPVEELFKNDLSDYNVLYKHVLVEMSVCCCLLGISHPHLFQNGAE